jgi:tetraacyldisaccharide-1-P 4'-kinase
MLALDFEVSVVLARDEAGNVRAFPAGENRHRNGILDVTIAPARASACLREGTQMSAKEVAERIAERDPTVVLVLNRPDAAPAKTPAEDDPYADYPVPDDLMW